MPVELRQIAFYPQQRQYIFSDSEPGIEIVQSGSGDYIKCTDENNAVVFRIRIGSHLYTQSGGFFSVLLHSALNLGIIRTAHSDPASTYPINSLDKRCHFAAPGDTSISEPAPDSM